MDAFDISSLTADAGPVIGWLYLAANSGRVLSYLPQIIAIWRCRDGAHAISLLTWCYWMLSHLTAVLYGTVALQDVFFVAISLLNLVCCAIVTVLASHRRGLLRMDGPTRAAARAGRPCRQRT